MDFFAKQDKARASTTKLVVMFALGVIAVVIALNLVTAGILYVANPEQAARSHEFLTTAHRDPSAAQALGRQRPSFIEVFGRYPMIFLGVSAAIICTVGLSALYKWSQLSKGGLAVAEMLGGRVINPASANPAEKSLLNIVEEMSIASGVPVPVVVVMDHEQSINAFAAGVTHNDAVIGVTKGCLETLSRDQLQGVIAHEYSHILNYDSALNIRLIAMLHGLMALVIVGYTILRFAPRTSTRGSSNKNAGGAIVLMLAISVACVVIGYIGVIVGKVIQAAVSRQREFLADASAVQFTRNPRGLIGAFLKIQGAGSKQNLEAAAAPEAAHMMFSQLSSFSLTGLLATHPPLDRRIKAIDPQFELSSYSNELKAMPVAFDAGRSGGGGRPRIPTQPGTAAFAPGAVAAAAGTILPPLPPAAIDTPTIPPELADAAEEPYTARCVVLASIRALSPQTDDRADQIIARSTDGQSAKLIGRYTTIIRQTSLLLRLPLMHHCAPALRQLSPSQAADFLKLLSAVVSADQSISMAEYCAYRIVEHYLPVGANLGSRQIKFVSLSGVKDSVAVALGSLAAASKNPGHSLSAGMSTLGLADTAAVPKAVTVAMLDRALTELASSAPPVKRRIIEAATATVMADGSITPGEVEQLRAFCAVLGVPVPALTQ